MKFLKTAYPLLISVLFITIACQQQKSGQQNISGDTISDNSLTRLKDLNRLIHEDSTNAGLYNERALLFLENEAYNDALKDAVTATELDSMTPGYFITLSDTYLGMGKVQSAIESLEKAYSLDADDIPVLIKLAEINVVIRDYKKAIEYIDKVMKLDDHQAKAYFLRGVVMLENKDTLHSIPNFQKAIDMHQDYFDAHLQLGLIFADKKNKLAVDYFNNALNLQPENTEVSYYLALFYQETGEYEKAIHIYEAMLQKHPDFYFALYNIGYVNLVYLNDYDKAIEYFTKAISIKPDYADAYYNRGFAYELKKDAENSRNDYKKALEYSPNYEKAINGMNRIDEFLSKGNK
jgi:tetratricopeptide (TPR) repeat protein